jgi:hypothetical protein
MALSRTTQDHDEIRNWAEARGAQPAEVTGTHSDGETGILRFCFPNAPNHKDKALREISWEEFFEKFDENNLELVYQEKTAAGQPSNFNKLVHPTDKDHSGQKSKSSSTSAKGKSKNSSASSNRSHAASADSGSHTSSHGRSGASKSTAIRSSGSRSSTSRGSRAA